MKKNLAVVFAVLGLFLLGSTNVSAQCVPREGFMWQTMWGGQNMYVGEYTVDSNSGSAIEIEVWGVDGWLLQDVHIAIVTNPADFPLNNGGNLKLNQFPWRMYYDIPTSGKYSITIPFSDFNPDLMDDDIVYIMIHATFVKLDSYGMIIQDETAFGGPCGSSGWRPDVDPWPCWFSQLGTARWAYYFMFKL